MSQEREGFSPGQLIAVFAIFLVAALLVYEPALSGPFLSDDLHYVRDNVYIHSLSSTNVLDIFDPNGGAAVAVVNYSPVHLMLHSVAWSVFGHEVEGHHVINVALHALASVLLLLLLLNTGVPRKGAVFGAALFLLHPANVEAVAWISQLKSSSALVLSLASLLLYPRRPGIGTALFLAALLAKPTAAFVVPVALLLARARGDEVPWKWLGASALIFVAFAVIEFTAHQRSGAADALLYETPFDRLRTIAALAMRYFAMAATSYGVSAFHALEPSTSLLDPWWLGSVFLLCALGWRTVVTLRARKAEAAYWVWAGVSFAPISQVFPFVYPMADRYLYFILPGLIGGALLCGRELMTESRVAGLVSSHSVVIARGLVTAGAFVLLGFAWHSHARAGIWRSSAFLLADSARHYPQGVSAHLIRANRAAQQGDIDTVVVSLRAAVDRGYLHFHQLDSDPALAQVREHPKFQRVVRDIALMRIERFREKNNPTQLELRTVARAYAIRGEVREAIEVLERALDVGGPKDAETRADIAELRKYL